MYVYHSFYFMSTMSKMFSTHVTQQFYHVNGLCLSNLVTLVQETKNNTHLTISLISRTSVYSSKTSISPTLWNKFRTFLHRFGCICVKFVFALSDLLKKKEDNHKKCNQCFGVTVISLLWMKYYWTIFVIIHAQAPWSQSAWNLCGVWEILLSNLSKKS